MTTTRKVIIIGSGPAGYTAAIYAARANLAPLVIEGYEAGGQLMLTSLVENWPGYRDGVMGPALMEELRLQAARFGAEIVQGQVSAVDLGPRPFTVRTDEAEYAADALIVATAGRARRVELRHVRRSILQGSADCGRGRW